MSRVSIRPATSGLFRGYLPELRRYESLVELGPIAGLFDESYGIQNGAPQISNSTSFMLRITLKQSHLTPPHGHAAAVATSRWMNPHTSLCARFSLDRNRLCDTSSHLQGLLYGDVTQAGQGIGEEESVAKQSSRHSVFQTPAHRLENIQSSGTADHSEHQLQNHPFLGYENSNRHIAPDESYIEP
ncbi:hypothetical protein CFIMG_006076RA [Ceratocystis fimbriata CBS 114723]|uniref:Uncharacterized protein n=1 Tax=Ceratocystis fimbriata CBS 114723 TaxID=1035309 RepID=A0A2C5WWA9_9PEZI|nr:hypothetical protein CFIMG_006076RA [Ceratocystis fimbriata CBS 114723]